MVKISTVLRNLISLSRTSAKRKNRVSIDKTLSESLEQRQVMSVTNPWFSGSTLIVPTDNNSTHVTLSSSNGNVMVSDVGTNRTWTYASSSVSKVEFQGGSGNDRFINNIYSMPVRGFGGSGNDYLEGYNGADMFVGGAGDDELVGYGGNDQMWGGDGNDILKGGSGLDDLMGDAGNDRLTGDLTVTVCGAGLALTFF